MEKKIFKATGCLWLFMESICFILFLVFLAMKLISGAMKWGTVFAPLIVGLGITVVTFLYVALAIIFEGKDE